MVITMITIATDNFNKTGILPFPDSPVDPVSSHTAASINNVLYAGPVQWGNVALNSEKKRNVTINGRLNNNNNRLTGFSS